MGDPLPRGPAFPPRRKQIPNRQGGGHRFPPLKSTPNAERPRDRRFYWLAIAVSAVAFSAIFSLGSYLAIQPESAADTYNRLQAAIGVICLISSTAIARLCLNYAILSDRMPPETTVDPAEKNRNIRTFNARPEKDQMGRLFLRILREIKRWKGGGS